MEKLKTELWGHAVELDIAFDVYEGESVTPSQASALGQIVANWDKVNGSLGMMDEEARSIVSSRLTPHYLFIPRDSQVNTVAIVCDDSNDPEHGLAVMFSNCVFSGLVEEDDIY